MLDQNKEWLAVDLDGTLAEYSNWAGPDVIGKPVPAMVQKIRDLMTIRPNLEIRVFTARCYPILEVVREGTNTLDLLDKYGDQDGGQEAVAAVRAIQQFTYENFGEVFPVTCIKDYHMSEVWDDRAVQVIPNKGEFMGKSRRGYA